MATLIHPVHALVKYREAHDKGYVTNLLTTACISKCSSCPAENVCDIIAHVENDFDKTFVKHYQAFFEKHEHTPTEDLIQQYPEEFI